MAMVAGAVVGQGLEDVGVRADHHEGAGIECFFSQLALRQGGVKVVLFSPVWQKNNAIGTCAKLLD